MGSGISGGLGEMDYNGVSAIELLGRIGSELYRGTCLLSEWCTTHHGSVTPYCSQPFLILRMLAASFFAMSICSRKIGVALPVRTLLPSFVIPMPQLPDPRLSPSHTVVAFSVRIPSFELSGGGAVELPYIFFACWHLLTSRLPELTTISPCPRNFLF